MLLESHAPRIKVVAQARGSLNNDMFAVCVDSGLLTVHPVPSFIELSWAPMPNLEFLKRRIAPVANMSSMKIFVALHACDLARAKVDR
jgi:hypothetical protein